MLVQSMFSTAHTLLGAGFVDGEARKTIFPAKTANFPIAVLKSSLLSAGADYLHVSPLYPVGSWAGTKSHAQETCDTRMNAAKF
jgi:hypothetical protein